MGSDSARMNAAGVLICLPFNDGPGGVGRRVKTVMYEGDRLVNLHDSSTT